MRRLIMRVSQERLADGLGVSFQQVQKYEKGSNRISASRLQHIASMLDVPASYFFDGAPVGDMPGGKFSDVGSAAYVADFLTTAEGVRLSEAFLRIKSVDARRRIIDLVEALADDLERTNSYEGV